jgi:hypothetical protein
MIVTKLETPRTSPVPKPKGRGVDVVKILNPPFHLLQSPGDLGRLIVGTEYSSNSSQGGYKEVRHIKGAGMKSYLPPSIFKVRSSVHRCHLLISLQTFRGGVYNPSKIDSSLSKDGDFSIERLTTPFIEEQINIDGGSINLKFRESVSSSVFGHHAVFDQAHVCI